MSFSVRAGRIALVAPHVGAWIEITSKHIR